MDAHNGDDFDGSTRASAAQSPHTHASGSIMPTSSASPPSKGKGKQRQLDEVGEMSASPFASSSSAQPIPWPAQSESEEEFSFDAAHAQLSFRALSRDGPLPEDEEGAVTDGVSTAAATPAAIPIAESSSRPTHRRNGSRAMSSHTAAGSSLGAASDFGFLSGSSASTAPTSIWSQSPTSVRKWQNHKSREPDDRNEHTTQEQAESSLVLNGTLHEEQSPALAAQYPAVAGPSRPIQPVLPTTVAEQHQPHNNSPLRSVRRQRSESLPDYYDQEPLPSYDSQSANISPKQRLRNALAAKAASSKLVPRRIARRLQSTVSGSSATSQESTDRPAITRRLTAPESGHPNNVYAWTASQYYQGVTMGPAASPPLRRQRPASARSAASQRSRISTTTSRPTTPAPTWSIGSRRLQFSARTGNREASNLSRTEGGTPVGNHNLTARPLALKDLRAITDALFKIKRGESTCPTPRGVDTDREEGPSSRPLHPRLEPEPVLQEAYHTVASGLATTSKNMGRKPALLYRSIPTVPSVTTTVDNATFTSARPHLFTTKLPREIQLEIFRTLCRILVAEGELEPRRNASYARGSEGQWRAVAELVKLSRVSKSFLSLALDGQLWQKLSFTGAQDFRIDGLSRLFRSAGSFVTELDLSNLASLDGRVFVEFLESIMDRSGKTNLTSLQLRGCKQLRTETVLWILTISPNLRKLDVSDVPHLDDEVGLALGKHCPYLEELNISRVARMSSHALLFLAAGCGARPSKLHTLRAAGLPWHRPGALQQIGRAFPHLRVLDLTGCKTVLDEHVQALVSRHPHDFDDEAEDPRPCIELTARQAGFPRREDDRLRATMPHLTHLKLSRTAITDRACAALAYGILPSLEVLELAGCPIRHDEGLVALLASSPCLCRLDLGGIGSGVTNEVLAAITPRGQNQPGSQLTHLNLSAARVANHETLLPLIQSCPKLHHLEVDNTSVDDKTVKRFVELCRERLRGRTEESTKDTPCLPAYLSVIDCAAVSRAESERLIGREDVRGRLGREDQATGVLLQVNPYESDTAAAAAAGTHQRRHTTTEHFERMLRNECDGDRVCVKTFAYWHALGRAERDWAKREARIRRKVLKTCTPVPPVASTQAASTATSTTAGGTGCSAAARAVTGAAGTTAASSALPHSSSAGQRSVDTNRVVGHSPDGEASLAAVSIDEPRASGMRDRVRSLVEAIWVPPVASRGGSDDGDEDDDDDDDDMIRAPCAVM